MPGPGSFSRVAIVGASSLRGKELKQVLEDRNFPATDIVLLDESVMAGTLTEAGGEPTFIRALEEDSFDGVRFAFFAGTAVDTEQSWQAAQRAGATVIDLTGALAASGSATMLIPSLAAALPLRETIVTGGTDAGSGGVVYSPPSPVIIASTVATAFAKFQPQRIALTLFPPVSEHDQSGIEELESQTTNLLSFRPIEQVVFDAQVAFNLLSAYGAESKVRLAEVRSGIVRDVTKYLAGRVPVPAIQLLQAPVFYGYAFAAYAEFASQQSVEQLEQAFANLGVRVAASTEDAPTNVSVAGESEIQLARIEADPSVPSGVWLWGVADNLRLAATNAVRIAEEMVAKTTAN
jgi:aspartate-semialdehyde dehydrogenase